MSEDQPEPFVEFEVWHAPVQKGSMVAIPVMKKGPGGVMVPVIGKNGRPVVSVMEGDKKRRDRLAVWGAQVSNDAAGAMGARGLGPVDGPIAIELRFYRLRGKGHYGTGRNKGVLKDSAPAFPATSPDLDKLVRAAFDAMKGKVWTDDSRVVRLLASEDYGPRAGMVARVWALAPSVTDVIAEADDELPPLQLSLSLG